VSHSSARMPIARLFSLHRLARLERGSEWSRLTILLVVAGAALRLSQYAANRSLWLDESALALNIVRRNVVDLLHPLAYNQGAPAVFLFLEKGSAFVVGRSELGLRALPLLAGLAALPVFVAVARRALDGIATPIAIGLFAVAEGPIYYASEVKPYSTDLLACLVLFLCAMLALQPLDRRRLTLIGVAGAIAIAVSFSAIISGSVLAAVVVWVAVQRRQPRATEALVLAAVWLGVAATAALAAAYELRHLRHTLKLTGASPLATDGTSPLLASLPLGTIGHGLQNYIQAQADLIGLPHGVGAHALVGDAAALIAVVGAIRLLRRRPEVAALVLFPLAGALLAIGLHAYPLFSRTVLFALPFSIILVAEGVAAISGRLTIPTRRGLAVVLTGALFAAPVATAAHRLIDPVRYEDMRAALNYLRAHEDPGDTLYLYYSSQYAFAYYAACGCTDAVKSIWPVREFEPTTTDQYAPALRSAEPRLEVGQREPTLEGYTRQLDRLRGRPRVWVLFSHANDQSELRLQGRLVDLLDRIGRRRSTYRSHGIRLYLFDLRSRK
jgi:hypothetical protein